MKKEKPETKSCFETLLREHGKSVLGLCMAKLNNFHDAEDAMQQTFLKAYSKMTTLRKRQKARSWLMQIAARVCIDHHRRKKPHQDLHENMQAPKKDDSKFAHVHQAINKLPDGLREPIVMFYMDGKKCASVSQSLGISEEAVRSRLCRARLRLHQIMMEDES